ncbi:MAG TPA: class II aldolase/adducin family protein, partial [Bacteroidales bacterium]|nr:class II aldolase/adducin family protein [Bacteroidales bacterium]
MKTELNELIEISRFYGTGKDYVIAGGGNTSFKDGQFIWIKASGFPLETLSMEGLVKLDRRKLEVISGKKYSDNPLEREEEVKNDLTLAVEKDFSDRRPSVETSLHNLIGYSFVVHLHPAVINGVLCSRKAEAIVRENFGDEALFIPYADPGYTLFKKLEKEISGYRDTKNRDPHIIFIENHGVFVGADTTPEIRKIYEEIIRIFSALCKPFPEEGDFGFNPLLAEVLPAIRMLLSRDSLKTLRWRNNALIDSFSKSQAQFQKISHALTPDIIVYCKHRYIYIDHSSSASRILESFRTQLERFTAEYGFLPRVIVIKDLGIIASGENYRSAEQILDVYEDLLKISWYASFCGGIKLLTPDQVDFIDKWEVENYRRKISLGKGKAGSNTNRIAVVTGAAQGFGAGIAGALLDQQMNIVVADINDEK